jgi:hypothetical protein
MHSQKVTSQQRVNVNTQTEKSTHFNTTNQAWDTLAALIKSSC